MFLIIFIAACIAVVAIVLVNTKKVYDAQKKYLGEEHIKEINEKAAKSSVRRIHKRTCEYCGTIIDTKKDKKCPHCGASYKTKKTNK